MRKVLIILLVFISLVGMVIWYGARPLLNLSGVHGRAGLRIESSPKSKVSINGKESGSTPYQNENLSAGEYLISLEVSESTASSKPSWSGYVRLNPGTLSVVNRELNEQKSAQSGEVITLDQGRGATITSTPPGADVMIDGKFLGRTPLSLSSLGSGEHQFLISKENFLKRSIRSTIVDDFNLNLSVDLAIAEADLTKLPVIPVSSSAEVIVKQTPTGFLNVRSSASTNGKIVAKVNPGDTLVLLEELPNWDRIRTADGKEGYVASSFVEKKINQ